VYTYLISSLAMLNFGDTPPFSYQSFLKICQEFIPERDIEILKDISRVDIENIEVHQPTLKKWYTFEVILRNELVKLRAACKKIDLEKYLRPTDDDLVESHLTHIAHLAYQSHSILEGEEILDRGRWQKLDDLEFGHYFDLDHLICYACKLLILERWQRIKSSDSHKLLEQTLQG